MSDIAGDLLTIVTMNGAILIIPGVNFLLVARQSLLNGFRFGFICALGITTAIMLHVVFSIFSIGTLLKTYPIIFTWIRLGGAAYLLFLGTCFFRSALKTGTELGRPEAILEKGEAFQAGFLTDLLNPFVSIFYLSLFTMLDLQEQTSLTLTLYGFTIFALTLFWFAFVAGVFANEKLRDLFRNKNRWIQGFSGVAMCYFAAKVVFGF